MSGFDWKYSLAPVKNTFIHFQDAPGSLVPHRDPQPWTSAPPVLINHTFRFRSMVKLAAATLEVSIQQVRDAASATLKGESDVCALGGALPRAVPQRDPQTLTVKNSFIHFDDEEDEWWSLDDVKSKLQRQNSAPKLLMDGPFGLKHEAAGQPRQEAAGALPEALLAPEAKMQAHLRGECKPCAYYWDKEDGCRRGEACEFCHLCDEGERKRRKKEKARQQSIMKSMMKQANAGSDGAGAG